MTSSRDAGISIASPALGKLRSFAGDGHAAAPGGKSIGRRTVHAPARIAKVDGHPRLGNPGIRFGRAVRIVFAIRFCIWIVSAYAPNNILYSRDMETLAPIFSGDPRLAVRRLNDNSSNDDSAFMLGNHHIVCARAAHGLRVFFVARSG